MLEDSVIRTVRSHLVLCCNMSPRCVRAMGVCLALALFDDAKQAMGEGKSGPVETGLTGPVATALLCIGKGIVGVSLGLVIIYDSYNNMVYAWYVLSLTSC